MSQKRLNLAGSLRMISAFPDSSGGEGPLRQRIWLRKGRGSFEGGAQVNVRK